MKWNTKSVLNIDDDVFIGMYAGIEFKFEAGEKRYLPTNVSEHLEHQLIVKLRKKHEDSTSVPNYSQILGEEIVTADSLKKLSLAQEIEKHENEFTDWQEKQEKEQIIKKDKALNIAKKDVRNIIDKSEEGERADDSQDDSRPESESGQVLGRVSPSPTREKVGVGGGSERTGGQEEQGGKRG